MPEPSPVRAIARQAVLGFERRQHRLNERKPQLGIQEHEHVRPWLQAFTLGKPEYGATQIQAEKKAVYDAGYDGWVMWNPGSIYDVYMPGLEKTLVSRKKAN